MTDDKRNPESLLDDIPDHQDMVKRRAPAPVHLWNPPLSGEMDMRIARDGTWYHEGGPIKRLALVQLFSGILRHDDDGRYYLVTPVERWAIQVDDAPFVAVRLAVRGEGRGQVLVFTTNLEDEVEAGPEHPIRVSIEPETGEPSPYVRVRDNLEALIGRNVFYELADRAVEQDHNGRTALGVWSHGTFFPIDGAATPD